MNVRVALEMAAARGGIKLLKTLSPMQAARFAGGILGAIGPWLPVSRIADTNLQIALPEYDAKARRRIIRAMWKNLGAVAGELPHLGELRQTSSGPGYEVEGVEILEELARRGGPAVFFSGHIGDWEMLPVAGIAFGIHIASMYRAAGNPRVDRLINRLRSAAMGGEAELFPKGREGARRALAHLKKGGYLAALVDQKMNDGIEAPLFGQPAMTAPGLALLALRFRCPVVPAHVVRLGPARLRLIVEPPLPLPASGDRSADVRALTAAMNAALECWIRAQPESWLWLHRRFPKERYAPPGRAPRAAR